MRMPLYPWGSCTWFPGKPNVGQLMDLCDENYRYLMRLAPDLRQMQGCRQSQLKGALDLYLEVLEQTPYTTLFTSPISFHTSRGIDRIPMHGFGSIMIPANPKSLS